MNNNYMILAPWHSSWIETLERYQNSPYVHSYTCPNRSDSQHEYRYDDLGALVPTQEGWKCPDCGYTQTWAHADSLTIIDSIEQFYESLKSGATQDPPQE